MPRTLTLSLLLHSSSLPQHEVGQGREEAPLSPDLIPCRLLNLLNCSIFIPSWKEKKKSIPRACYTAAAGGVNRLLALGLALKIGSGPEQAWGPQRGGWPRLPSQVGRGPRYFKAGMSQAPSTPKSAGLGCKMVREMRGGRMKRRGAMNSGICWGEKLGGLCCKGRFLG